MFDKTEIIKGLIKIAERTGHADYVKTIRENIGNPMIDEYFGAGLFRAICYDWSAVSTCDDLAKAALKGKMEKDGWPTTWYENELKAADMLICKAAGLNDDELALEIWNIQHKQ